MELVLRDRLVGEFIAIALKLKQYLLRLRRDGHLYNVAPDKLEGLIYEIVTLILLFWSARRWDQLPPLELII
jgi:hypothetical protein